MAATGHQRAQPSRAKSTGHGARYKKQEWVEPKRPSGPCRTRGFSTAFDMTNESPFPSYHLVGLHGQLDLVVPKLLALPIGVLDLLEQPQLLF